MSFSVEFVIMTSLSQNGLTPHTNLTQINTQQ